MLNIQTSAEVALKTLRDPKSPANTCHSWYPGSVDGNEWLIGDDQVLNSSDYFIVITALFVTFFDNFRAQQKLVTEQLGIKHSHSLHNPVFLKGVKSALRAAKKYPSAGSCADGVLRSGEGYRVWSDEENNVGLQAFGIGWMGFTPSAINRERLHELALGYKDLEDFMVSSGAIIIDAKPSSFKMLVLPGKADLHFRSFRLYKIEVANMKSGIGTMETFSSI
ncbi:homoserine acetyltransferase [Calycina marina]|uniref:Homoserine acetyltransferase n=1 Tax=Calycina marina TaxID=1763456 RepID=A0A9P7Z1C0_9HELO|nr:homoserine acetyltransferase [Calycina marina]